ncbi:MAG TPA: SCO family protein [Flavisolibacter sp.]|nr:SCO family protein [Flavisolibacter sp.]
MSKRTFFYILFFAVLTLGFYFTLAAVIPGFTKKRFPPIGKVEPFSFINQDGVPVTQKDIAGKVVAVNYFFTTCNSVCPRMNNNLKPVYEAFKSSPDFLLLSHTSDPDRDSVGRLKRYADSMQVNGAKWMFLTGRKDSLYNAARHSYRIENPDNFVQNISEAFVHTQFVALVNRKSQVVKIYDGLKPSEMKLLADDIKNLLND